MGLFDRIRGEDSTDEVELQVPGHALNDRDNDEVELGREDDEEEFILPGFTPRASEAATPDDDRSQRSRSRTRSGRSRMRDEVGSMSTGKKLDRLLDQNEKIISLLEEIADRTDDDTAW